MAATLMMTFKMCRSIEEGEKIALEKLQSGTVAERFRKTVELQGGDSRVIDEPEKILPSSKFRKEIFADQPGFIQKMDALSFGKALVQLGGGRLRKEDGINYGAGFVFNKKVKDAVKTGDLLYTVHYDDKDSILKAEEYLKSAVVTTGHKPPSESSIILGSM
jgi:pyrimidine-nucleoside phosphorylase